jgi:osmotically-inducible protein OsmY
MPERVNDLEETTMKTDAELQGDVRAELAWDPKIKDAAEIAVAADRGTVTLRGTVGSLHQRRAATDAAKRVRGTFEVDDQLDVRLMDDYAREDAEVRAAALQALQWNALVPADGIDVQVEDGHLLLTGAADWTYEKEAAEATVAVLTGVVAVRNDIEVRTPAAETAAMAERISEALRRSAQTHAKGITITVADGAVILEGTVASWAEHDEALATASAAPGVRLVEDRLSVTG